MAEPRGSSFLAVDFGAESGRAVLARLEGGRLTASELHRFPNVPLQIGASWRWDVDALWRNVRHALEAAPGDLASVGIDAWGCDYALVGGDGALVEPPYCYRDPRTDGVMARVFARVPADRIYEVTGIQHLPFNTLYQLYAASGQTPEVLARADRLLTVPDYFNFRLTGRRACEYTSATTTQCVEASTRQWARSLLDEVGVPSRLFGEIVQPGIRFGTIAAPDLVSRHGLPVVAPACHDTGSAVASIATGRGTAFLSSGTWSLVGAELPAPVMTAEAREWNFTNEGGVGGTTRLLKNVAGLWLLQSCRRSWAAAGKSSSYGDLIRAAADEALAFGAILDPDDEAFTHPEDMVRAIAAYCRRTHQREPGSPAAYVRTILESLALKYRLVIDRLEILSGAPITTIRVIGGGAKNRLLNQLTADATGRTVIAGPVEATAIGNVALQMVATGAVSTLAEARRMIGESFPVETFEPSAPERWDAPFRRLRDVMEQTCA